jgi:ferric-dicitrate binding protein FerR (iron transport regulator)
MKSNVLPETSAGPRRIRLTRNSFWSVQSRPNEIEVECREGKVWITQEGDDRDVILRAGGQFRIEKRGRVIVQAVTDAEILIRNGRHW